MSQIRILRIALCLLTFFAVASRTGAQTITIDSVSASSFCAGDPIAVTFTVTGTWGRTNAFTFQLSDQTGSFDNSFTYLGSIVDTLPGTFTIVTSLPLSTRYSAAYRVRVIGAAPYVTAESSTALTIGAHPLHHAWSNGLGAAVVGVPRQVTVNDMTSNEPGETDTLFLDFGEGAEPRTETQTKRRDQMFTITYSTSGPKVLVARSVTQNGCSVSDSQWIYAYDCTSPVIPHDAIIVSSDSVGATYNKTYWVNPGITFHADYNDTIFAEAGANIVGTPQSFSQTGNIVYLKPGATSNIVYDGAVIHALGAGVDMSNEQHAPTLLCTDLTFDYAVAPANSVMHINESGVMPTEVAEKISLAPNPTNGEITIAHVPARSEVVVLNVLGQTMMRREASESCSFDLSTVSPGTYYVRISSAGRTVTKKIIKE